MLSAYATRICQPHIRPAYARTDGRTDARTLVVTTVDK